MWIGQRFRLAVATLSLLVALASSGGVLATSFTVDGTIDAVDANPGDGVCATAAAECTLRAAIQETNALAGPDAIQLPDGIYVLAIVGTGEDSAATGDLDVLDSVSIAGDSVSGTTIEASQIDRAFHVLGQASLSISSITVRGGDAVALFPLESLLGQGAGFFVDAGAQLSVKDMVITGNRGTYGGGAVANHGRLTMESTIITGNVGGLAAEANGGGGILNSGDVSISDSTVIRNASDIAGGGIFNSGSIRLMRTTVADNAVFAFVGGGIYNSGSLRASERSIIGNRAEAQFIDRGEGGGIYNLGELEISSTTISGNYAKVRGGAIDNDVGSVTLNGVTVNDNNAGALGGAISNAAGSASPAHASVLRLTNVTITRNTAGTSGGGVINGGGLNQGAASLTNVTVSENSAPSGAGIRTEAGYTTRLNNTIVADSAGENCSGSIVSADHNLSSDSTCLFAGAGDIENADPLLGPLQDNGGATQTHALLAGSPAIDAGDNNGCPGTDQRGIARPVDANSDGVAICDIGAFEAPAGTTLPTPAVTPEPTATPGGLPAGLPRTGGRRS